MLTETLQPPTLAPPLRAGCFASDKVFYHSGDLGDVIYALPTVKALGGGVFYLGPDNGSGMPTREAMTRERAGLLIPLLAAQPYISRAEYRERRGKVTHDLNDFRLEMVGGKQLDLRPGFNLARVPLKHFGLPVDLDLEPWLTVDRADPVARVVVSRSLRYRASNFNWKRICEAYRGDMVFVGSAEEHEDFCRQVGEVPYCATPTLLDLARVIAGAELFVGNQSCPYAVAVGLGKPAILEHCDRVSNCIFRRSNLILGCGPGTVLPEIQRSPGLEITCPLENFTGYGQLVNALASGLSKRGLPFELHPFCRDERLVRNLLGVNERVRGGESDKGLLICSVLEVPERLRKGQAVFTMWEATRLAPDAVKAINERAVVVIVPTWWNASCFGASGVNVPLRVVPLGVDPGVYNYREPEPAPAPFRFGTAGRLAHAGARKGIEETIAWFQEAFPTEKDVELHVKIFEDCPLDAVGEDPRIVYCRRFLPQPEMVGWYTRLHCFVSATKGEGWGLHIQQAMAVGRAVIAPCYSGQSAFMNESNALCCKFELVAPDWSVYRGHGQWSVCDRRDFVRLMRYAYEHRAECVELGQRASDSVARFTWSAMVDGVVGVLREFSFY